MCGIAGIVDFAQPVDVEDVRAMTRLLAHRGPDDSDDFSGEGCALGHRRLSIIDLSEAGRQPMSSADGRFRLVFNGEIYNYRELRAELERDGARFRTQTDSEVILAGYERWGERCVERFDGMWAFALWDVAARRLFCSRDRFGIKPFYYRFRGSRFVFASEPKALRALEPLSPDPSAVRDFLEYNLLDHGEETFFAGVKQLLPAHSATLDERGLRIERYWRLELRDPPPGDAAEALREAFLDSIRLHLRSDVPVGTCLSGGLDSSSIACAVDHLLRTEAENARPVGERQQTFTAFFEGPGVDERAYARAVVEQAGAAAHWISFSADELVESLPGIVAAHDEPFGSTSIVAQYHVMKAAREAGMKVMLDGQGGDELLGGYPTDHGFLFADLLERRELRSLREEVAEHRARYGVSAIGVAAMLTRPYLPPALTWRLQARRTRGSALTHDALRRRPFAPPASGNTFPDRLRRQLQFRVGKRLPELLRYEDRNSMAHSLEARVPFLEVRLVELAFSLRARDLVDRGSAKAVLRRALGDLLPPAVRDRRDKLGFETPEKQWLRGALGELAHEVFHSKEFVERGFVDPAEARRRLVAHRRGEVDAGFEIWRVLNLELWAREHLDA